MNLEAPRNDKELAKKMNVKVQIANLNLIKNALKPDVGQIINSLVGRGKVYYKINPRNAAGGLAHAWTTDQNPKIKGRSRSVKESARGIAFPGNSLDYDNSMLTFNPFTGRHTTPTTRHSLYTLNDDSTPRFESQNITNLFEVIDKGLGGPFLGDKNPTMQAAGLSEAIEEHINANLQSYVNQAFAILG